MRQKSCSFIQLNHQRNDQGPELKKGKLKRTKRMARHSALCFGNLALWTGRYRISHTAWPPKKRQMHSANSHWNEQKTIIKLKKHTNKKGRRIAFTNLLNHFCNKCWLTFTSDQGLYQHTNLLPNSRNLVPLTSAINDFISKVFAKAEIRNSGTLPNKMT